MNVERVIFLIIFIAVFFFSCTSKKKQETYDSENQGINLKVLSIDSSFVKELKIKPKK